MLPKTTKGWFALIAWVMLLLAMWGKFFINLSAFVVYREQGYPYWDYDCYVEFMGFGYDVKKEYDMQPHEVDSEEAKR